MGRVQLEQHLNAANNLGGGLPSGTGSVVTSGTVPVTATITVQWDDSAAQCAFALPPPLAPSAVSRPWRSHWRPRSNETATRILIGRAHGSDHAGAWSSPPVSYPCLPVPGLPFSQLPAWPISATAGASRSCSSKTAVRDSGFMACGAATRTISNLNPEATNLYYAPGPSGLVPALGRIRSGGHQPREYLHGVRHARRASPTGIHALDGDLYTYPGGQHVRSPTMTFWSCVLRHLRPAGLRYEPDRQQFHGDRRRGARGRAVGGDF